MERMSRKSVVYFCAAFLIALLGQSCASTKAFVSKTVNIKRSEGALAVEMGEKVSFPAPLPDYYPLKRRGGSEELIAKGWDLNKDGRLDQIDVLGLEGQVIERLYDFDGDGQIDLRKAVGAEKSQARTL